MLLRIIDFKGTIPRLNERLLPDNYGQTARNVRLETGAVEPINLARPEATLPGTAISIHKHLGAWLSWNSIVDAVPGPVAADRLYFTGDGVPKMRQGGSDYDLALPAPAGALTLTPLSAVGINPESILYTYTYVTSFGEESQPAPISAPLTWTPGVIVQLTGFSAAPAGRGITHMRIYRSETSAGGITALYFVSEVAVATVSYDHDLAVEPLVEVIRTTDFDPPQDTLTGLISLPNGMMAAFVGKELYFCEPYEPHAWPQKYSLTVDYAIVGLAAFGSVLAVLTTGTPYIMQGSHPESMAQEKMDKTLPCLSRRGIVDIGYACYFPTNEGLAVVTSTGSDVVTRNLFTREQWEDMSPASFVADSYNGRYIFTHTFNQLDVIDGGAFAAASGDTYDAGDFSNDTGTFAIFDLGSFISAFGSRRVGSIDLIGDQPFFMDYDTTLPEAMFADQLSGELFMLHSGTEVVQWNSSSEPIATMTWRSKRAVLSFPTNFGALLVQTDRPLALGDTMTTRVIADGAVVATVNGANTPNRLPSGFMAKEWEVEIEANVSVTAIALANTMQEIEQAS